MKTGLGKMEEDLQKAIDALDLIDPESYAKITFYKACQMTLEGLKHYMLRFEKLAQQQAQHAEDDRKKELEAIAENCRHLTENKPETFWQGLQLMYFILAGCMMEGNGPSYSPGRVDQYLYPCLLYTSRCV